MNKINSNSIDSTGISLSKKFWNITASILLSLLIQTGAHAQSWEAVTRSCESISITVPDYLVWKTVIGYYAKYLGVKWQKYSKQMTVNHVKSLEMLWRKKMWISSRNRQVRQFYTTKNSQYQRYISCKTTPTRMTLNEFIWEISKAINQVKVNLDWSKIKINWGKLSPSKVRVLRHIWMKLTARDILTYGMTEILPGEGKSYKESKNKGIYNTHFLDMILRSGWKEFVSLIPALWDSELSFWLYQLTKYAIWKNTTAGINWVNMALPRNVKIPINLQHMSDTHQHKAAYMFAISNLWLLVKKLWTNDLKKLVKKKNAYFLKYIALSHHQPSVASKIFASWLKNWDKSVSDIVWDKANYGKNLSVRQRFVNYLNKTFLNALWLNKWIWDIKDETPQIAQVVKSTRKITKYKKKVRVKKTVIYKRNKPTRKSRTIYLKRWQKIVI